MYHKTSILKKWTFYSSNNPEKIYEAVLNIDNNGKLFIEQQSAY